MKENQFDDYIKKLVKSSANLFSVISLITILIAFVSPIDLSAKTQLIGFMAFLCVIYSGYRVWKDAIVKIPSENDFKIINKKSSFRPHAFLGDGRIDQKSHFTIDFDFINRFDQSIVISQPEIISLSIDGEIFESNPASFYFKKLNSISQINFPYSIEKLSRESLRCEIDIPMIVNDRIAFAEKLNGLNEYCITINFVYEDMSASTKTVQIQIDGNFDEFKEEVLNFWKKNQHFELICKATGNA